MSTPIFSRLMEYAGSNRIPFAMPGHKNMRGINSGLFSFDVTELDATPDLLHESAEVREANRLLRETYGARESFILTGGSTAAVQIMLTSVLSPGDILLASADCHKSVINTCAICGFRLRLIPVEFDAEYGIPRGTGDFEIDDGIKAVLLTSPNYYGVVKDVAAAAGKCRAAGVPLLIDEAHGAHFAASDMFPETAVRLGADMVCQSAHKTLPALTGAAYLHICGRIDPARVRRMMKGFCSSSPSYPIAASADIARAELMRTDYGAIAELSEAFTKRLEAKTRIRRVENDDITRIVLNFSAYDTTGFYVNKILSEKYSADCEMADLKNIVLILTPCNTEDDMTRLFDALIEIADRLSPALAKRNAYAYESYTGTVSPSFYVNTERVALSDAVGRVSAETVSAYPPGTAIILPGEIIRRESIDHVKALIAAGAEPEGIYDDKAEVVV